MPQNLPLVPFDGPIEARGRLVVPPRPRHGSMPNVGYNGPLFEVMDWMQSSRLRSRT